MSGITSTIHDSGRVYLFDKNALPKNFIESGMKLSASGLAATVDTGSCDIGGKYHELADQSTIALPQRTACLVYALKSDLTDTPTLDYAQAAFPAADAGTVCRYVINGAATIASSGGTGGGDLIRYGGVTQVDGWIGYGGKGDGSTGYYVSANSTGFPAGTAVAEWDVVVTFGGSGTTQCFVSNSPNVSYAGYLGADSSNQVVVAGGSVGSTGYTMEVGKTYYLCWQYDGTNHRLYVNGVLAFSSAATSAQGGNPINIFRWSGQSTYYSASITHYFELRNALRTPGQISAISNALLLPVKHESEYQIVGGTNIGTMTGGGGLVSAFNGVTGEAYSAAANITGIGVLVGTIGKNWGAGLNKRVKRFIAYGSDVYFSSSGGTIRCRFYGSNSGLGMSAVILWDSGNTTAVTLGPLVNVDYSTGLDVSAAYQYHWFEVAEITGNGGSHVIAVSELLLFAETSLGDVTYFDIRAVLPANSIALGFARTNSSAIIEIDDSSYKYGRREGAVGGNRRVFLGWKWFSGETVLSWDNPFASYALNLRYAYKENIGFGPEYALALHPDNSTWGVFNQGPSPARPIAIKTGSNGAYYLYGAWKTSGYIGCYAEVIE